MKSFKQKIIQTFKNKSILITGGTGHWICFKQTIK